MCSILDFNFIANYNNEIKLNYKTSGILFLLFNYFHNFLVHVALDLNLIASYNNEIKLHYKTSSLLFFLFIFIIS